MDVCLLSVSYKRQNRSGSKHVGNSHEPGEGLWMVKDYKCPEKKCRQLLIFKMWKFKNTNPQNMSYKEKWQLEEQRLPAKVVTRKA